MSTLQRYNSEQFHNYYIHTKEYKAFVDQGTTDALHALCEAEVQRDLLGLYAHTSNESYKEWVIADRLVTKAEQTYQEWLCEKEYIDEEYFALLDDMDRHMFSDTIQ